MSFAPIKLSNHSDCYGIYAHKLLKVLSKKRKKYNCVNIKCIFAERGYTVIHLHCSRIEGDIELIAVSKINFDYEECSAEDSFSETSQLSEFLDNLKIGIVTHLQGWFIAELYERVTFIKILSASEDDNVELCQLMVVLSSGISHLWKSIVAGCAPHSSPWRYIGKLQIINQNIDRFHYDPETSEVVIISRDESSSYLNLCNLNFCNAHASSLLSLELSRIVRVCEVPNLQALHTVQYGLWLVCINGRIIYYDYITCKCFISDDLVSMARLSFSGGDHNASPFVVSAAHRSSPHSPQALDCQQQQQQDGESMRRGSSDSVLYILIRHTLYEMHLNDFQVQVKRTFDLTAILQYRASAVPSSPVTSTSISAVNPNAPYTPPALSMRQSKERINRYANNLLRVSDITLPSSKHKRSEQGDCVIGILTGVKCLLVRLPCDTRHLPGGSVFPITNSISIPLPAGKTSYPHFHWRFIHIQQQQLVDREKGKVGLLAHCTNGKFVQSLIISQEKGINTHLSADPQQARTSDFF